MLLATLAPSAAIADTPLNLHIEAAYTNDDNVNRAADGGTLHDGIYGLRVSDTQYFATSSNTRVAVQGFVGGEKFRTYTGLSHYYYGAQGEFQYRPSGEFSAPIYSVFARTATDRYESTLRDGYRHSAGVSVLKPVTDRIQFFGTAAYNIRDGKSTVFDARDWSLRANLDYALVRRGTLYLGAEYRRGDVVSSAHPSLALVDIAAAIVRDDAFANEGLYAYRFKADTVIATLGYNHAFGNGQSIDISWQRAASTPREQSAYGSYAYGTSSSSGTASRYVDNQITFAYLVRF